MSDLIERLGAYLSARKINNTYNNHIHQIDKVILRETDLKEAITAVQERDALKVENERLREHKFVQIDGLGYPFDEWIEEAAEGNIDFGSPLVNSIFQKLARWSQIQEWFEDEQGIYPDAAKEFTDCGWLEMIPVTQAQIDNGEAHEGAVVGDSYWHTTFIGYQMAEVGGCALYSKFQQQARQALAEFTK